MLKGILFVIAIIITFDIGKAMIEAWNEEEVSSVSEVEHVHGENSEGEEVKENLHETIQSSDDKKDSIWNMPQKWIHNAKSEQTEQEGKDASSAVKEESTFELIEGDSAEGSDSIIIDYTLPSETLEVDKSEDLLIKEPENPFSNRSSTDKKVKVSAKPIVIFNKKDEVIDIEKPKLEGATMGIKIKLD